MADNDQKTESPTDKRKQDSVQKGDVLQSRELTTAPVLGIADARSVLNGHLADRRLRWAARSC